MFDTVMNGDAFFSISDNEKNETVFKRYHSNFKFSLWTPAYEMSPSISLAGEAIGIQNFAYGYVLGRGFFMQMNTPKYTLQYTGYEFLD